MSAKDDTVRQFAESVEDELRLDDVEALGDVLAAAKDDLERNRMELSRKEANQFTFEVKKSPYPLIGLQRLNA